MHLPQSPNTVDQYSAASASDSFRTNPAFDTAEAIQGLGVGEVGYLITGVKDVRQSRVGDTVTNAGKPATVAWRVKLPKKPLSGLQSDGADGFWLAYADGTVVRHAAADGLPKQTLDAHRALAGGPWLLADRLVVQTPDGGLAPLAK